MAASIILAWLVHFYTALGAVIAFAAAVLIEQKSFQGVFWLMSLAVVIDATDGTLARAARVKDHIPWFDGDRLEDIIDYANYAIIPCLFLWHSDLLPRPDSWWIATLPLLASAYGFCQKDAKTPDHFFLGFPSYWNIVVFYLYALQTPRWINGFCIIGLSILVFVPIKYVYPSRSPRYRLFTNAFGALWGISILAVIYLLPDIPRYLVFASLAFPAYYTILSLRLNFAGLHAS